MRVPLVLLPGMDGTEILFGPLRAALPEWIEPVGVTYPVDGRNDYDEAVAVAAAAVDRLATCHVLGWSFSGPIALRLARTRPERVRSVTLVASFVTPPLAWLGVTGPLLATPLVGIVRTLRRLPIWLGRPPDDPLRRDKARLWQTVPARALAGRARAIRSVDARDDLRGGSQPILYLQSARDRVVPPRNLDRMRTLRPDIEVATLPGGHFALYPHAADGARAIARFVARHEPSMAGAAVR